MELTSSSLWSKLLEFIFPCFCLGCEKEGTFLCRNCFEKIERLSQQICPICHIPNHYGLVCERCRSQDFYLDGFLAACRFETNPLIKKCIHALKYGFVEELAEPLSQLLATTGRILSNKEEFLFCPVPLHSKRKNFRGFNQAEILAKIFCQLLGIQKHYIEALRRTHFLQPQMELSREERLKNVSGVFVLEPDMKEKIVGAKIVLIDDVATTMATLNQCAKVLKQHGATWVHGLVVAHG